MSNAEQRKQLEELMSVVEDQIEAIERNRMGLDDERKNRKEAVEEAFRRLTDRLNTVSECCDARWLETNEAVIMLTEQVAAWPRGGFWSRLQWLVLGR